MSRSLKVSALILAMLWLTLPVGYFTYYWMWGVWCWIGIDRELAQGGALAFSFIATLALFIRAGNLLVEWIRR